MLSHQAADFIITRAVVWFFPNAKGCVQASGQQAALSVMAGRSLNTEICAKKAAAERSFIVTGVIVHPSEFASISQI